MCSDGALPPQNTDVRKFPCGNFLPLRVKKPRYTPPVFWNLQSKFYFMRAAARMQGIGKTALADDGGFIGAKTINYCSLTTAQEE